MGIVRVAINALALVAAALLVPGLRIRWGPDTTSALVTVGVLAVIFGVVNAFLGPVARLLSLPLNVLTLGLYAFVLNAGLLLLVAAVVDTLWRRVLVVGGFPPTLSVEALVAATAGALVISLVSTAMAALIPNA